MTDTLYRAAHWMVAEFDPALVLVCVVSNCAWYCIGYYRGWKRARS